MDLSFLKFYDELDDKKRNEIENLPYIDKGMSKFKIGDIYNHLTILGRAANSPNYNNTYVFAICDCSEHNIKRFQLNQLKSNKTISCGCEHKKQVTNLGLNSCINMLGKQIGSFKIIEKTNERDSESVVWIGKCIYCGNLRKISQRNMRNEIEHPNICECQRKGGSSFEQKISRILFDNNIKFLREKTFENFLYEDTNRKPRFDFFLPDYNLLIEVHGKQHYQQGTGFMKHEKLEVRQKRDLIKINWALKNNYSILVIPYNKVDNLTLKDLLPNSKFVVKEVR